MSHTIHDASREPWYGLGVTTVDGMSTSEMLRKASLDWEVMKLPLGQLIPDGTKDAGFSVNRIGKQWSLTRVSDMRHLSVVGDSYDPTQNSEAIEWFDRFVRAGGMKMRAFGSVKDGKHVWGLAKVDYSFELPDDDLVEGHVLLSSPHILGQGITIKHANIRVIGMNTVVEALRDANGERVSFRIRHLKKFDDKDRELAQQTLLNAKSMTEEFSDKASFLASRRAQRDEFKEFVCMLTSPKVAATGSARIEDAGRPAKKIYETLDMQPGRSLRSSNGTWWGAVNAVFHTVDHVFGRGRDMALTNAWFGHRAALKLKAISVAMQYAEKSKAI